MNMRHFIPELMESVEIEWEQDEEIDRHDHEVHYIAYGEDELGRKYEATWIQIDGDNGPIEIEDIVMI